MMAGPVTPTVIFRDVAVYFSEKEWELLEKWQRDLYTGVIKEIHGILISLGFIILNPNNFLRIQPEDEPCRKSQNNIKTPENICGENSDCGLVNPDILLTVQLGEKQRVADSYKQDGGRNVLVPSTSKFIDKFGEYTAIKQETTLEEYAIISEIETLDSSAKCYPCNEPTVRRGNFQQHSLNNNIHMEAKHDIRFSTAQGQRASSSGLLKANTVPVPQKFIVKKPFNACDKGFPVKSFPKIEPVTIRIKSKDQLCNTENVGLGGRNLANYAIEDALINRIKCPLTPDGYGNKHNLPELSGKNREGFSQRNTNTPHMTKTCIPEKRPNPPAPCVISSVTITNPLKQKSALPFRCSECEKTFRVKAYLINHRRTHTGERPYKCSLCEKSFCQKSNLNVHFRTHTGERPYACPLCSKRFIDNSGLIQHKRIHTGEKPFHCLHCQKRFSKKEHLKVHARTHTKDKSHLPTYVVVNSFDKGVVSQNP
ncbi:zinc finger protein 436-like isoform X2 [Pelobates fuscus]|uniref:zinc finger protein 436-like isoform X2 n=1 Tax=Pelobates fuscus TaxID=191477 RepID=UPI002FE4A4B7